VSFSLARMGNCLPPPVAVSSIPSSYRARIMREAIARQIALLSGSVDEAKTSLESQLAQ
jgi:hypothetical protein